MDNQDWRFGVVGNIVSEHIDKNGNVFYGTKPFTPGTKVYLDGRRCSYEKDEVYVIGKNRFRRMVLERIPVSCIENIRAQRIFDPHVIKIMNHLDMMDNWQWWGRTSADRRETKKFVEDWKNSCSGR